MKESEGETKAMLAAEAADMEARRERGDEGGEFHPVKHARDPAQVYAIRMPVESLGSLRRLADQAGIPPSALMRQWLLERLELETSDAGTEQKGCP